MEADESVGHQWLSSVSSQMNQLKLSHRLKINTTGGSNQLDFNWYNNDTFTWIVYFELHIGIVARSKLRSDLNMNWFMLLFACTIEITEFQTFGITLIRLSVSHCGLTRDRGWGGDPIIMSFINKVPCKEPNLLRIL